MLCVRGENHPEALFDVPVGEEDVCAICDERPAKLFDAPDAFDENLVVEEPRCREHRPQVAWDA